jgi:hypothetical protein
MERQHSKSADLSKLKDVEALLDNGNGNASFSKQSWCTPDVTLAWEMLANADDALMLYPLNIMRSWARLQVI